MKTLITFLFLANIAFGQTDKLLHASAGYVSSSLTSGLLQHYHVKHSLLIGIGVGTCLGIGKEIYDKYSRTGDPDPKDAIATIGGAILGSFTVRFSLNKKEVIPKNPVLEMPEPAIVQNGQ